RSERGQELMTPGSLMLGSAGWSYDCGHEHGAGDRCVSFSYEPEFFERLASDAGVRGTRLDFGRVRLPPVREMSPFVASAASAALGVAAVAWQELAVDLAARTLQLTRGATPRHGGVPPGAAARVTRVLRLIDHHPHESLTLSTLARHAGL